MHEELIRTKRTDRCNREIIMGPFGPSRKTSPPFRKGTRISLNGGVPAIDWEHEAAPEAIPIDHDVRLHVSIGPTIPDFSEDHSAIGAIWDRVLHQPRYDTPPITYEMFGQLMKEAVSRADVSDPIFGDDANAQANMSGQGNELESADQFLSVDGGVLHDPFGEPPLGPDELPGTPGDRASDWDETQDLPAHEEGLSEHDVGPGGVGSLDEIVEELAPPTPSTELTLEERLYENDLAAPPWMMPGP
jgi:hypothetical protein